MSIWEDLIVKAEETVAAYRVEAKVPPLVGRPQDLDSENLLLATVVEDFTKDFTNDDQKMSVQVMLTALLASRNAEREHGLVLKDMSLAEILEFVALATPLGALIADRNSALAGLIVLGEPEDG
jgi:hypothetical protein